MDPFFQYPVRRAVVALATLIAGGILPSKFPAEYSDLVLAYCVILTLAAVLWPVLVRFAERHIVWRFKGRPPRTAQVAQAAGGAPRASEPIEPIAASGDTLRATGTVSDPTPEAELGRLLSTCYVMASVDRLKDAEYIEFCVVGYNASPRTLSLANVGGNVRCTFRGEDGVQVEEKLPVPYVVRPGPSGRIEAFSEFVLTVHQPVSAKQSLFIRGTIKKEAVTLDLRGMQVDLKPYLGEGPVARLQLWDGVNIRTVSGPHSNRVNMLSAKVAMFGGGEKQ